MKLAAGRLSLAPGKKGEQSEASCQPPETSSQ